MADVVATRLLSLVAALGALLCLSCATFERPRGTAGSPPGGQSPRLGEAARPGRAERGALRLVVLPPSLKVLRDERRPPDGASAIRLDAARGESESAQLLLTAGEAALVCPGLEAPPLLGPGGFAIQPELGVVGYVPVTKPTIVGSHRRGEWPDPVLPAAPFEVSARRNQALWYSVTVPREAPAGRYEGSVRIAVEGGEPFVVSVELLLREVTLPERSFLKTAVKFRRENTREWYGPDEPSEEELALLGLRYRFSTAVDLPLDEVFSTDSDGRLLADWSAFDRAVELWMERGITAFKLKPGINWSVTPEAIHERFGPRLEEIDRHLGERGWLDLFYFYFYDEPSASEMKALAARLEAIKAHAPRVRNVLTYGVTTAGERKLKGLVGIWVPNIHQYDPGFAASRRALGEETWVYTCVGNVIHALPDHYRVDWYGAAHRALGWWLFRYGAEGYLYWGVDVWRRDPWKNAETFPWTNGDGMLFYPAPKLSPLPLPSIRAHLLRDTIEDYDLLKMLEAKAGSSPAREGEVADLLSAKGLILSRSRFSRADQAYVDAHRRLLELLETSP